MLTNYTSTLHMSHVLHVLKIVTKIVSRSLENNTQPYQSTILCLFKPETNEGPMTIVPYIQYNINFIQNNYLVLLKVYYIIQWFYCYNLHLSFKH